MVLPIKPLSQRDEKWADKKLPGGGKVADVGCLITCLAMQFGTTPDKLLDKDIFSGNYVNWGKASKVLDFQFQWVSTGDFEKICLDRADKGLPTIIRISNFEHFVLCVGYDDTTKELFINDPLRGETYYLKATGYKTKSLRLVTPNKKEFNELEKCWEAHKQAVEWANKEKAEKEKLQEELNKVQKKKEELEKKVFSLEKSLSDLEKENTELRRKLGEIQKNADEWQKELETANKKILKLEEEIESLESQKQQYKRWYERALNRSVEKLTLRELIRELLARIKNARAK